MSPEAGLLMCALALAGRAPGVHKLALARNPEGGLVLVEDAKTGEAVLVSVMAQLRVKAEPRPRCWRFEWLAKPAVRLDAKGRYAGSAEACGPDEAPAKTFEHSLEKTRALLERVSGKAGMPKDCALVRRGGG